MRRMSCPFACLLAGTLAALLLVERTPLAGALPPAPEDSPPSGDAVIRARAGESDLVLTTTSRLAGAIHSLTWDGKEFIDSHDHGRQLQSASNLDCGKRLLAETYNPTEAGSRADGAGPRSSSRLLKLRAAGNVLETTTQMAFWLEPGGKSGPNPAYNTRVLSDHLVSKRVVIGYRGLPGVLEYLVTFGLPRGEFHTQAVFEAVTGYMPPEFSEFWKVDPVSGKLARLDDGPGEQAHPVVLSTPSGGHAMGVYSPQQPSPGFAAAGYGRFRFKAEKVVKWNCVFRVREPKGLAPGDYRYRCFVCVGTRDNVAEVIGKLRREHARP